MRRPAPDVLDVDVAVECSTGTYVRALARDLGAALGTGGHLTALRRTRVGPYAVEQARTLEQLVESFEVEPLADVVTQAFGRLDVDADAATAVSYGRPLPAGESPVAAGGRPVGVFGPDGALLALMRPGDADGGRLLRPVVVFAAR
jgi:tRNA pseudouridine55 synthase